MYDGKQRNEAKMDRNGDFVCLHLNVLYISAIKTFFFFRFWTKHVKKVPKYDKMSTKFWQNMHLKIKYDQKMSNIVPKYD